MLALAGCSSSEDIASITVPNGTKTKQTIDVLNAFYRLPVQSQGKWTASVEGDDSDWIYLVRDEGDGNSEVLLSTSTNLSDAQRSAIVRITDETGHIDYTLTQVAYDDGVNGKNDVQYANSGLGMGIYIEAQGGETTVYEMMASQVFQFNKMADPLVADLGDFVTTRDVSSNEIKLEDFTKEETSGTDVAADLSVDVKYGLFNLNLTGDFHMFGASRDTTSTWAATAQRPMTNSTLGYAQISGTYPWKKEMDDSYKAKRACLFSSEFLNLQDKIETLIGQGVTADSTKLTILLDSLNDEFGPTFIKSVTRGGTVSIDFQKSKSSSTDTLSISGTLGVGFNSLFSLDVKASADYLRQAESLTTGGSLHIKVEGGSTTAQDSLISSIGTICNGGYDEQKILNAITSWTKSIDINNSVMSGYTVNGIWNLFSTEAKQIVKTYIKSKYPAKDKDGNDISYMFAIQKLR